MYVYICIYIHKYNLAWVPKGTRQPYDPSRSALIPLYVDGIIIVCVCVCVYVCVNIYIYIHVYIYIFLPTIPLVPRLSRSTSTVLYAMFI